MITKIQVSINFKDGKFMTYDFPNMEKVETFINCFKLKDIDIISIVPIERNGVFI